MTIIQICCNYFTYACTVTLANILFHLDQASLDLFQSCGDFDSIALTQNLSLDFICLHICLVIQCKRNLLLLNLLGTNVCIRFSIDV